MLTTWNERFRECQATGRPVRFEYRGTCPSSPAWVAATLSPMDSPGSGRALCSFIVEDITDRKRTEEELVDAKVAGRGGFSRQGSFPGRAQSRAPHPVDTRPDRRLIAFGIESPSRRSCQPSR